MGYLFSLVPGNFQMCAKVLIACLQDNISKLPEQLKHLERRKDAWPLLGRHLNFQAGQPWQPLLMTKFREEGEEDRGPWLVDQIYFHPTLQFWKRSKYSDISLLLPTCTNELQCYVENSFSPLQGSLRSHRKGLCHKLDTGSKWLHPCEPARH